MSKSKEELNALKERIETVSKELQVLTDEELEQVTGGIKFSGLGLDNFTEDNEPGIKIL